jgi:glycosyltransferase involved in cell wall biosynthesis
MKVLIVNKHASDIRGGSEIQCDLIAQSLHDLGHEVIYLAVGGKKNDYGTKYSVLKVSDNPLELYTTIKDIFPDIVYWRSCRYIFPKFMKYFKGSQIPIVFAVSNRYDLVPQDAFMIYKSKVKAIVEYFKLRNQLKFIKRVNGVTTLNPDYLRLIPTENKTAVLNAMVLDSSPFHWPRPYCVWVANLKELKRPEAYVELAKQLDKIGIDFLMVGRSEKKYDSLLSKENIPGSFHYLGEKPVDEVNGILKSSLFHVHTCHPEGFGNIFIQAWLCGKPSVSLGFDPGGFIKSENVGIDAKNDFNVFVNSVKLMAENENLRKELGNNALKFANNTFSPEALGRNVESFLNLTVQKFKVKDQLIII